MCRMKNTLCSSPVLHPHQRTLFPQEKALVTCAYFSGGIAFTIGAYLGFFEVINVGRYGMGWGGGWGGVGWVR